MKFKIEDKIFGDFNKPFIGVIIARGIDNQGDDPEIGRLLREAEDGLRKRLDGVDLVTHPYITPWREAYRKFGSKPRDFRCSAEALARVVLRGSEIRSISKLVDLYNLISIKHTLPVGAEDLDKMQGNLVLGYAKGDERYTPLGGQDNDSPAVGEVIYKDDLGVICRRWNWRESDRTKISENTKNAIVVLESLVPISQEVLMKATKELAGLIEKYCKGQLQVLFLSQEQKEISFDF